MLELRGSSSQEARLQNAFQGFQTTITDSAKFAGELIEEQAEYASSVAFLRESGTRVIQQMRDLNLGRVAADTFQLVVGTLDFAGPNPSVQEFELRRLLVTLGRDQRVDAIPGEVERLRTAIDTIITRRATSTASSSSSRGRRSRRTPRP